MYNAPYFQIVKSSGNTRDDNPSTVPQLNEKQGYDLLEGAGIAKNVLVIGAVNGEKNAIIETNFSTWGPTDDGRIKPDLVAKGEGVYSSIETTNSSYALYNGTSSAAASVSAAITLLQQYYQNLMGKAMISSTVRALLIHTAQNIGNIPGPNYRNGWGLVDSKKAAETIANQGKTTMIREEVYEGTEIRMLIAANGQEPLVTTLAWTDPSGEVVSEEKIDLFSKALKNDLDIRIERMSAQEEQAKVQKTYYPWKLQGMEKRTLPATNNSTNDVDNIEKIEIPASEIPATGGLYHVVIKHKGDLSKINEGKQPFSLIVSGASFCSNPLVLYHNQDNIAVDSTVIKAKNIRASNIVTSQAQGVKFYAQEYISLEVQAGKNKGFEVQPGADFEAQITNPCKTDNYSAFTKEVIGSIMADPRPEPIAEPQKRSSLVDPTKIVGYPNPMVDNLFNVQFELRRPSSLVISIYNMSGLLIKKEEVQAKYPKGEHKKVINMNDLPKGIYNVIIQTEESRRTIKVIKN